MSNKNYNKNYIPKEQHEDTIIKETERELVTNTAESSESDVKSEIAETKPEQLLGVVFNCIRLNIRRNGNMQAPVIAVLKEGDTVIIDEEKSGNGFYRVATASVQGYCREDYITFS